ncbi:MAG: alanine racemase, partial [Clostridia bacterium]|nr:alanine racemase [Clostridia bacterium]
MAEIDLSAIRKNTQYLSSLLKNGSEAVAVIKADAYGHGARAVCREIKDIVSAFAVATPEEAHEIL